MKISHYFAIGLASVLVLAGCDIEKPYEKISGVDKSKAAPIDVTLDEDGLSSTGISVYWDGSAAVQAGALSFTTQLVTEIGGAGDNYNTTLAKTSACVDDAGNINDAAIFSKLATGALYYVRVRANYAYSVCSEWSYLQRDGSIIQVCVGKGVVISEFTAPQDLKGAALTYSSIKVSWAMIGPCKGYEVSYKKSDDSEWTVAGTTDEVTYTITGLEQVSIYDIRVRGYRGESADEYEFTDYTVVEGVATPERPEFDKNITTAAQLREFLEDIAVQAAESDEYLLGADIDMAGTFVTPASNFLGIFDGQNHTVKNLDLKGTPLFEKNSGVIKNVVLEGKAEAASGSYGVLVNLNAGKVQNCTNKADITLADYADKTYLGGVVGTSEGEVTNCSNSGNITVKASTTASNSLFGGVVGSFKGTVDGCTNSGNITYEVAGTPKNPIVGGVVGGNIPSATGNGATPENRKNAAPKVGTLSNCKNTGKIALKWDTNASGSYTNVGGVAGYLEADITKCENEGQISLDTNTDPAASNTRPGIGGVAGYVMYSASECTNRGKVSVTGVYAAGTDGNAAAGSMMQPCFGGVFGGVGYGYLKTSNVDVKESMTKCSNYGEINITVTQKTAGGTKSNTGGVAGYCSTAEVSDCHNYGTLTFNVGHKIDYVGGVIGLDASETISGCTNEGAVTYSGRAAEIGANTTNLFSYQIYFGGIVGYVYAGVTVSDCHNKAEVCFKEVITTAALSYIGGINGSYSGTFYMNDCSNTATVKSESNSVMCIGGVSGAFNGVMTACKNEGPVQAPNASNATGKETELGGVAGYVNGSLVNCISKGAITTGPAGTYCGGLIGGFGDANQQMDGCTVDCTVSGAATIGAILGRYRSPTAVRTLYYKNMTFGTDWASLPMIGYPNGCTAAEGTLPEA